MTIREALREPITVQALTTLVIGLGLGMAFSIATLLVFGSLMSAQPDPVCAPGIPFEQRP